MSTLDATSPYASELPDDWKSLADNKDKDLEKGASIDTVLAFNLENDKLVVFKAADSGNGKFTVKGVDKLPVVKPVDNE